MIFFDILFLFLTCVKIYVYSKPYWQCAVQQ